MRFPMVSGASIVIQIQVEVGKWDSAPRMGGDQWLKHMRKNDPCVYCGSRTSGTIDHIVPTNHGGHNTNQNKAPCCDDCNNKKGSIKLLPFLMFRKVLYGEVEASQG